MFFRIKSAGEHDYLLIIESYREEGRVRKRVIANFGRLDRMSESGKLLALWHSFERIVKKTLENKKRGGKLHHKKRGKFAPLGTRKKNRQSNMLD